MKEGTVKWFNSEKGFGFIECDGKDYFVHFKEIKKEGYKELKTNEKVGFISVVTPKGATATNVVAL